MADARGPAAVLHALAGGPGRRWLLAPGAGRPPAAGSLPWPPSCWPPSCSGCSRWTPAGSTADAVRCRHRAADGHEHQFANSARRMRRRSSGWSGRTASTCSRSRNTRRPLKTGWPPRAWKPAAAQDQQPNGRRRRQRHLLGPPDGGRRHVPDTPFQMPTVRLTVEEAGSTSRPRSHERPCAAAGGRPRCASGAATSRRWPAWPRGPGNRLLIGDFNATYDHAEFRALLDGGPGRKLVDVGTAAGLRLVPTWPMEGVPLPGHCHRPSRHEPADRELRLCGAPGPGNGPCRGPGHAGRPGRQLGSAAGAVQACLRMSLWVAACATGRITIWSRLTWCGAQTA